MEILRTTSRRALRGALAAGLAAGLAGCDSAGTPTGPRKVFQERVVVHSVLMAGADTVSVVLTSTSSFFSGDGRSTSKTLSGATVRLVAGGDTIPFVEQAELLNRCAVRRSPTDPRLGTGCYLAALPGGVQAGATYELSIETVAHGTVRGRAKVPTAAVLLEPVALTELTVADQSHWRGEVRDPVMVRWHGAEPGRRLELSLRTRAEGCRVAFSVGWRYGENIGVELAGPDTASLHSRWLFCPGGEPAESYPADIYLTVYDSAYTSYMSHLRIYGSTPRHRAAFGVEGALGVFAGAATTTVPVTLVVQQDTIRP